MPDPLYVEINDETKNRHVRLQGWIRDDGEPHFYDIRAVAIDQRQHEDPAEPDPVSPEDLQRWKAKVVQGAIKYATDGDATVPKAWPSKEQHELDRRIARETVRELRRKRGRPGRPGQPWETKKQAHKLNRVDGVALKDLADQYRVSTSTVGRWVKEVDAATESHQGGVGLPVTKRDDSFERAKAAEFVARRLETGVELTGELPEGSKLDLGTEVDKHVDKYLERLDTVTMDDLMSYAVRQRFGLSDGRRRSYRELGEELGITAEAARHIVKEAVQWMRDWAKEEAE